MAFQKKSSQPDTSGSDAMDPPADLDAFCWRLEEEAPPSTDESAGTGARSSTDECARLEDMPAVAAKECLKCHESHPLSNFYDSKNSRDGKRGVCIPCWKQDSKKQRDTKKRACPEADTDDEDASSTQERAPDSLYIMANPRIPGEVKIGRSHNPEHRSKQLSAGNNFCLQALRVYGGVGYLEKVTHQRLKCRRVENVAGTEWFQVSRDQADTVIKSVILEDEFEQLLAAERR